MNHSEAKANLFLYIDGDFPKETSIRMDTHLRDCAECRQTLNLARPLWATEIPLSSSSHVYFGWTRLENRIVNYNRHTLRETVRPSLLVGLRIATVSVLLCGAIMLGKHLGDFTGTEQADGTKVISQLHLDKFQLPESDPFINTVVRFNEEFGK
ncbi:MAG: zf-HC2 domain-containing protein [bacterium]